MCLSPGNADLPMVDIHCKISTPFLGVSASLVLEDCSKCRVGCKDSNMFTHIYLQHIPPGNL